MSLFDGYQWGLNTDHTPRFGARAILQRGYIDVVGDRTCVIGEPDEAWREEANKVIPHFIKELGKLAKSYQLMSDMDQTVRLEHKGWVCEANPRKSYGYLYLDVYKVA